MGKIGAKDAKGGGKYASFPLEITCVSAKGLPAMDDNGECDPYLEIKLRSIVDGQIMPGHPRPQGQVCMFKDATRSPTWGDKLQYSVAGDDAIYVVCYDEDTKGKDFIGEFTVLATDLDLE